MNDLTKLRFGTVDAARITGIDNKSIAIWVMRSFLIPVESVELGRRKKNYSFDFMNLVEIEILKLLGRHLMVEFGFIRKVMDSLRKEIKGRDILTMAPFVILVRYDASTMRGNVILHGVQRVSDFLSSEDKMISTYKDSAISLFINLKNIADKLLKSIQLLGKDSG